MLKQGDWAVFSAEVLEPHGRQYTRREIVTIGADGYPRDRIATLHTGSEAEAHADIIKAAPDMLAALKDARDGLRYWEPVTERGHREKARIYGAVDTAISRAQGDLP